MKKLFVIALAIITCLSLAACGGKSSDQSGKQPATADVVEAVASQLTFKDELMTLDHLGRDVIFIRDLLIFDPLVDGILYHTDVSSILDFKNRGRTAR